MAPIRRSVPPPPLPRKPRSQTWAQWHGCFYFPSSSYISDVHALTAGAATEERESSERLERTQGEGRDETKTGKRGTRNEQAEETKMAIPGYCHHSFKLIKS